MDTDAEAPLAALEAAAEAAGLVLRYERDGDLVHTAPDSITAPDGTRLWNAADGDGLPPGESRARAVRRIASLCARLTAANKGGWHGAVEGEPGEDQRPLGIDAAVRLAPAPFRAALELLARATAALGPQQAGSRRHACLACDCPVEQGSPEVLVPGRHRSGDRYRHATDEGCARALRAPQANNSRIGRYTATPANTASPAPPRPAGASPGPAKRERSEGERNA